MRPPRAGSARGRPHEGLPGRDPCAGGGHVRRARRPADDPHRPERLRQDDDAEDRGRPDRANRGAGHRRGPPGHRARPGARLRVPGLRPAAVGHRAAQRRLRAGAARRPEEGAGGDGGRVRRQGRPGRLRAPLPAPAVRRDAPAGRAGQGAGGRCRRPAHGRAVRIGRRADPPHVPGGPAAAARRGAQDGPLRDPLDRGGRLRQRPDRDPDPRAGSRDEAGAAGHPARRHAGRDPPQPALPRRGRGDLGRAARPTPRRTCAHPQEAAP